MRGIFGVVSLLVVVAIVGLVAKKQLQAVGVVSPASAAAAPGATPSGGNVHEQSQALQQKVVTDVQQALGQGTARTEAADK
jgi:hypothetical protein